MSSPTGSRAKIGFVLIFYKLLKSEMCLNIDETNDELERKCQLDTTKWGVFESNTYRKFFTKIYSAKMFQLLLIGI